MLYFVANFRSTLIHKNQANKDQETASHFWNESAKELRLEGVPRKAEWAEWAADNARKNQDSKKMLKNVEEPFIPVTHFHFFKIDHNISSRFQNDTLSLLFLLLNLTV